MLMKSTRSQPIEEDRMLHTRYSVKNKTKGALFEERFRNFPGQGAENPQENSA